MAQYTYWITVPEFFYYVQFSRIKRKDNSFYIDDTTRFLDLCHSTPSLLSAKVGSLD
ncbi:hypothetical protein MIDIC_330023 [Alphaproteobacteria bacterium]